jgi:hypothetical protein
MVLAVVKYHQRQESQLPLMLYVGTEILSNRSTPMTAINMYKTYEGAKAAKVNSLQK